ncbi:MAG TPA: glycosyltransferase [Byssovorax sp.]
MTRLAHVWSSDMGLSLSLPYLRPFLARGWEVFGICPPGPRVELVTREGVRWLPHGITRAIDPAGDAAEVARLYRCFREHRFDVVHTHNAKTGILARLVATAARVPVILHTHHGMVFSMESPRRVRWPAAALERAASARVDRLLVQSGEDRDALVETGAANPNDISLVGNGIDLSKFDEARFVEQRRAVRAELGVGERDVLFFSAGRVVKEKGFVELFEAYERAHAKEPRVRLAVAGPADTDRGLGVPDRSLEAARRAGVLLLGERADMPELYAASDVVALASWREGLPRVLIEGAAMGKPLLATDVRGCREVVKDTSWGVRVPVRDAEALAGALVAMTADAELRATVGAHNRAAARERYDLAVVVGRIERIYDELLAKKGRQQQKPR